MVGVGSVFGHQVQRAVDSVTRVSPNCANDILNGCRLFAYVGLIAVKTYGAGSASAATPIVAADLITATRLAYADSGGGIA